MTIERYIKGIRYTIDMSTDFLNWNCDDLTTEQKAQNAKAYEAKITQGQQRTNAHDINDALMENPTLELKDL